MSTVKEFIESGKLELYVMGMASAKEAAEVEQMAAAHVAIRLELDAISIAMEGYAEAHAVQPRATVKPLLMASIDYIERMSKGKAIASPPELTPSSKISDYKFWLEHKEMVAPEGFEGVYAKLLTASPEKTIGIGWLKGMTDYEVHHKEYESFLIVEGSCEFIIGEEVHNLAPGDYIAVPLHTPHWARITSDIPCKVIIQRLAA